MHGKDEIRTMTGARGNAYLRVAIAHGAGYNTSGSRVAGLDVLRALRAPDCANVIPGEPDYGADMSTMLTAWAFPEGKWDARKKLNCLTIDVYMQEVMAGLRAIRDLGDEPGTLAEQYAGTKEYLHAVGRALAAISWFRRYTWTITYNEFAAPRYGQVDDARAYFKHCPRVMTEAEAIAHAVSQA